MPYWSPLATGTALFSLIVSHDPSLPSVARIADVIAQDTSLRVQTIRLDGGVSRGDFVCQTLADLTGAVVERPRAAVDMTAWGAAALAGLSAGVFKDVGEIAALRY